MLMKLLLDFGGLFPGHKIGFFVCWGRPHPKTETVHGEGGDSGPVVETHC